jgi:hypothetical protein
MITNWPCGSEELSDRGEAAPITLDLCAAAVPALRDGVQDLPSLGPYSTLFMDDLVNNRPLCA